MNSQDDGKNPIGRPSTYSKETVQKLVECFKRGLSVNQACIFSDVPRSTYYQWLETQPGFADIMEAAQNYLVSKAREVVAFHVEARDLQAAKFLLSKKDAEFKDKLEVEHHNADLEDHREKIKGFLNDPNDDDATGDVQPAADQETPPPTESVS